MVKHQRRSHQGGLHPNEHLDDCSSESDSGESPSTPQHPSMSWSHQDIMPGHSAIPQGQAMHRAATFSDFGQHMNGYPLNQQQQEQYHRHSVSSGIPHEYHDQAVSEHSTDLQMVNRTSSMPQPYYVTDQGNANIAAMNTNPIHSQYHLAHQHVERPVVEIPYSAPGITASVQSSPNSFSPVSGRSPSMQGSYYTHQPSHPAAYALHGASPTDSQQPPSHYPQQVQQTIDESQHTIIGQTRQNQNPTTGHYHQNPDHPGNEQWYQCPPPIEVTTIGQLPPYGAGVYDLYGPKIEFDDPSMQLPSSRLENL